MPQTQSGLEQGLKLTSPTELSASLSPMRLRQTNCKLHRITQLNWHFLQATLGQLQIFARTVRNQRRKFKCNGTGLTRNPFLKRIVSLFTFRERGREGDRERNMDMREKHQSVTFSHTSQQGVKLATQACALTRKTFCFTEQCLTS